jgi:transposase
MCLHPELIPPVPEITAKVAPNWLERVIDSDWYDRYGQKDGYSRKTRTTEEKEAKAIEIGTDGFYLLEAIYHKTTPDAIRQIQAVEVLRQVWLQQYYAPTEGTVLLRTEKDGPPNATRIFSPYETEARKSIKRSTKWTGYKVHLTETCILCDRELKGLSLKAFVVLIYASVVILD